MNDQFPADPITPSQHAGIAMYEMYKMYISGGFNEDQALKLIAMGIAETVRAVRTEPGETE